MIKHIKSVGNYIVDRLDDVIDFLEVREGSITKFVKTYQEILVWLPPAIAMVFFTRWLFPQLDPTSGIDGLGQLNAMVVNLVGGIVICFSAWLTKRTYDHIFTAQELQSFYVNLFAAATPADKAVLLLARAIDLGVWAMCFYFWFQVIF